MNESPAFSIIIPSYLSTFKDGAIHREQKFIRAVDSCLNQLFTDYEIIIVADGCKRTVELFERYYKRFDFIKCFELPKQQQWSGTVRNHGIDNASGKYITYLDTDDKLGHNHLSIIYENISSFDWVWYDDYLMTLKYKAHPNKCELKLGHCGTSNITHKNLSEIRWTHTGYSRDDLGFISNLLKFPNYTKITIPEYFICHQPRTIDV